MNNLREDLNSNIMQSSEQIHLRMEALQEKIISRANSRATSRAASRAVSPTTLAAKLNVKLKGDPVKKDASSLVPETPRAYAPPEDITRTSIVKGNDNAPVTKAEFLKILKETVTFTGLPHNYLPTEQNLQTFLQQLLVYKDRLYRAIEFLLLFEGTEDSLPTCDNKPQGLLKLISDTVPYGYIKNLMESDGPLQKYKDVYEFFKRVAVQSVEFDSLAKAARKFSTTFGGPEFLSSERNRQRFLTDEFST